MRIETIAARAGHSIDPATGAVTPPIHLSTTFERDTDGGYPSGYVYARNDNPNRRSLEECVVSLEGGVAAAAFSSGSAATAAVFQSLSPGITLWRLPTATTGHRGCCERSSNRGDWKFPSRT